LLIAWWSGFEPRLVDTLAALAPALAGGWAGGLGGAAAMSRARPQVETLGETSRYFAQAAFLTVVRFERRLVAVLARIGRALGTPARDLHTGDAQEYLLFLAGVAVLALVLPLLR
jgi:hypothetical protein